MKFILTNNEETASLLRQRGFICVGMDSNGMYRFINDRPMNFSEDIAKTLFYTDKINM